MSGRTEDVSNVWEAAHRVITSGKYQDAIKLLEEYLQLHPEDIHALYLECHASVGLSDFAKAKSICERMKKIDRESFEYHASIGAVLTDDPSSPKDLALIQRAIKHMQTALAAAPKGMLDDPQSKSSLFLNLANAQSQMFLFLRHTVHAPVREVLDAFTETVACFNKALDAWPGSVEAWTNKGNLLDEVGRYVESLECYEKAIKLDPKHGMALGNRGLALTRLALDLPNNYRRLCAIEGSYFLKVALGTEEFHERYESDAKLKTWVDSFLNWVIVEHDQTVVDHLLGHLADSRDIPTKLGKIRGADLRRVSAELAWHLHLHLGFGDELLLRTEQREDWVDLPVFLSNSSNFPAKFRFFLISLFDRYRTARNLLVLAFTYLRELAELSEPSRLEFPGYSLNGELLKEAQKSALDTLDSVAHFLVELGGYNLNRPAFSGPNSVFHRTSILQDHANSRYLVALASLSNDIMRGEYYRLDRYRNISTHEYILLIEPEEDVPRDLKLPDSHCVQTDEFAHAAITSLRVARAALLYLLLFTSETFVRNDVGNAPPGPKRSGTNGSTHARAP